MIPLQQEKINLKNNGLYLDSQNYLSVEKIINLVNSKLFSKNQKFLKKNKIWREKSGKESNYNNIRLSNERK